MENQYTCIYVASISHVFLRYILVPLVPHNLLICHPFITNNVHVDTVLRVRMKYCILTNNICSLYGVYNLKNLILHNCIQNIDTSTKYKFSTISYNIPINVSTTLPRITFYNPRLIPRSQL